MTPPGPPSFTTPGGTPAGPSPGGQGAGLSFPEVYLRNFILDAGQTTGENPLNYTTDTFVIVANQESVVLTQLPNEAYPPFVYVNKLQRDPFIDYNYDGQRGINFVTGQLNAGDNVVVVYWIPVS